MESTAGSASSERPGSAPGVRPGRSSPATPATGDAAGGLQSGLGTTTIADAVVSKVAGIAAREVPGVHDLGAGATRALGAMTRSVGFGDERMQGVGVEVGEEEAAVDLVIVIDYGESIPQVSNAVRENVVKRVEGIVGLRVNEVNITVNDLYFPGDEEQAQPAT